MSNIKFKIAAKTNIGRVRTNNEDNFQAASDLTTAPMKWVNDMECDLGNKGALLVVADGMGGMNAGEVASEIAINTIRDFFSPEKITEKVLESRVSIESFMKNSIVEADKAIKKTAKEYPEHKGMGTTMVIAWLLGDTLYVAWCGDSRAYLYNHVTGLKQISKDHSFVQTLVDKGKISAEDAFDYPDSNIITRCLGDSSQKARPDTLSHPITVHNGDIILLCTDGLSGMIRDHEIETVIANNEENMLNCCDQLIDAACEAAGEDNVTVALCRIVSGATDKKSTAKNRLSSTISFSKNSSPLISRKSLYKFLSAFVFALICFILGYCGGKSYEGVEDGQSGVLMDSLSVDSVETKFEQEKKLLEERVGILSDSIITLDEQVFNLNREIDRLKTENKTLVDSVKTLNENLSHTNGGK